jgi:hypothetical protein
MSSGEPIATDRAYRRRMRVCSVTHGIAQDGQPDAEFVRLISVWQRGATFAQATIQLNDPTTFGRFRKGQELYLILSDVGAAAQAAADPAQGRQG